MRKNPATIEKDYENCTLCPRNCNVNRNEMVGACHSTSTLKLARAALHFWEEPCISGTNGSGAIFFSGCSLGCVFCQNRPIARGEIGKAITKERLAEIMLKLQEQGANNINLVTAGHFLPHVIWALEKAKASGLTIPIVYNCGGYEKVESLRQLEGLIDIYLPDFKYDSKQWSYEYSRARDYKKVATLAMEEMVRQQPKPVFFEKKGQEEEMPLMKQGVIVRQLLLPGLLSDAKHVTKQLYQAYGNNIYYSFMSQYTPMENADLPKALRVPVDLEAYEHFVNYAIGLGIENGFFQGEGVAKESFIPHFDYEGV